MQTHESFINRIREVVLNNAKDNLSKTQIEIIKSVKLCYGGTDGNIRGITVFDNWQKGKDSAPLICINPICQSSYIQIFGTVIHELSHAIIPFEHGHDKVWKEACGLLGLVDAKAAGQDYQQSCIEPSLFKKLNKIAKPTDGLPNNKPRLNAKTNKFTPAPCSHGQGSRGGKSRGKGSGSRMKKYICICEPPIIIRHAGDDLDCRCNVCKENFYQPR
jgi:hypothetical protein